MHRIEFPWSRAVRSALVLVIALAGSGVRAESPGSARSSDEREGPPDLPGRPVLAPAESIGAPARSRETERVRAHLRGALASLHAAPVEGPAGARRRELVAALESYVEVGRFPRNQRSPRRLPRFIDDRGHRCAVAHLMIISGHGALAARIQAAHEYDTIDTIASGPLGPEVAAWATAHGFMLEELAHIQPAYGFEPVERVALTEDALAHFVRQEERGLKLCLRRQLGNRPSELRVSLAVRRAPGVGEPDPNDTEAMRARAVRELTFEGTPALEPRTERCMRERVEYFLRNVALHHRLTERGVRAEVRYEDLNVLSDERARELRAKRAEIRALLRERRAAVERCHPTHTLDRAQPAVLQLYLLRDGRVVLERVDNGPEASCVAAALGLMDRRTPLDRHAEPFEARVRLRRVLPVRRPEIRHEPF
ncbi:MAG: hypothetical protein CMN30_33835 [Sandaracinus sp.]|nr:hypothetical protein [Sandaracinus sp.]